MNEKINSIISDCFDKLCDIGLYFQCGTLVFNNKPKVVQGLHISINTEVDDDE